MRFIRRTGTAAIVGLLLGPPSVSLGGVTVPTYEAEYEVEYKGRSVGTSTQTLTRDAEEGVYRFESSTRARGLLRLLRPRPLTEQSVFDVRDGELRPLEFRVEDGTRKGEDDIQVRFDWADGQAHVRTADAESELSLSPGVYDRITLQLRLMQDLAASEPPGPYQLIDDEAMKTYQYSVAGEETIETPAGRHETVKVTQRREGSSRRTVIWSAPSMHYLPVKIEQRRDGEALTTLTLESVEGL